MDKGEIFRKLKTMSAEDQRRFRSLALRKCCLRRDLRGRAHRHGGGLVHSETP